MVPWTESGRFAILASISARERAFLGGVVFILDIIPSNMDGRKGYFIIFCINSAAHPIGMKF